MIKVKQESGRSAGTRVVLKNQSILVYGKGNKCQLFRTACLFTAESYQQGSTVCWWHL